MKYVFTIVTHSHIAHALSSIDSYRAHNDQLNTNYIIFTDTELNNSNIDGVTFYSLSNFSIFYDLFKKYKNLDYCRWAMKPVLLEHILLNFKDTTECLYIDSDLYFVGNVNDICTKTSNVLLSPHFRPFGTTDKIFSWWQKEGVIGDTNVFTDGYFNGGFVYVKNTKISLELINWWKNCCISKCVIDKYKGLYVDQKYLDFMFMHFDGVDKIIDRGCNIAVWNIYTYDISDIDLENNYFLINNQYTPKFFHLSGDYISSKIINHFANKYNKRVSDLKQQHRTIL
jgi:hypothetical protein